MTARTNRDIPFATGGIHVSYAFENIAENNI